MNNWQLREEELEGRCQDSGDDRGRQHRMPHGGRGALQRDTGQQRQRQDDRDIDDAGEEESHRAPSLRAFAIMAAIRWSCSSVSFALSPPRSAATACSGEPSKKVSTRWRSADLRAVWRATAGM